MSDVLDDQPYQAIRNAFDAPWPGPRGPCLRLADGDLTASIHPADGGRLTSLTAFGVELLRPWTSERRAFQYGCFPMVPWVGRLSSGVLRHDGNSFALPVNKPPHALHGMACFAPWEIVETSPTAAEIRFALDAPWPWRGSVAQRYELSDNTLTMTLTVATAGAPFPAAAGWHPWFRKWLDALPGEEDKRLRISFAADWQEEPGADELPTGRRVAPRAGPWDDCFGFDGPMRATLLWPGSLRLDMSSPVSSMVVFDKPADAACVEPLSGPPNGVNTAPSLVSVAEPLVVSTRWTVRG